jgi:hypothetical protein
LSFPIDPGKAVEVNYMMDRAEFTYAIFPLADGRTGVR